MLELKFPKIGFGTWQLKVKDCVKAVLSAIEIGYRHIDTAQMYGNEHAVGKAISEATIDRKELIIATKIAVWRLRPGSVLSSTRQSLEKLQLDYIDILYIHWPAPFFYRPLKTFKAMSRLVDEGKVKHIAVSNFTPKLLDKALDSCDKPIVANQVEHHPWLKQEKMREYLNTHNMYLVAYSPLARGKVFQIPELSQVAQKHNCSASQVSLAWIMQHGAVPIPKSKSENHIRNNFEAINLTLDTEDLTLIDSIQIKKRLVNPPFVHPKW